MDCPYNQTPKNAAIASTELGKDMHNRLGLSFLKNSQGFLSNF